MEIKMLTDLSVIPQMIDFNYEEIEADLAPKLEFYKNLVVTEESIKQAKSDKANLNKLKKALDDYRKEVKAKCLTPYQMFEIKINQIIDMIDEPVKLIDTQIKAHESNASEKKYKEISEWFESIEKADFIALDAIINPKWKNVTLSIEQIKEELITKLRKINAELKAINASYENEVYYDEVIEDFKKHFELSKTLVFVAEKKLQYERLQKAQQTKEQAVQASQAAQNEPQQPSQPAQAKEQAEEQTQAVKRYKGRFEVVVTAEQYKALQQFMKENGIEFKIIKE